MAQVKATIPKIATTHTRHLPYLLTEAATATLPGAIAQAISNLGIKPATPEVAAALADINTLRKDGASPDLLTVLDSLEAVIVQTGDPGSFARWILAQATPNGPAIVTEPGTDRTLIEAEVFEFDKEQDEQSRKVVAVFVGHETGNSAELDGPGVDQLIEDLELFVSRLRDMRAELAAAEAAR